MIFDVAVLGLGAAVVPLYTTSGVEETRHVIADSGARLIGAYGDAMVEKLRGLGDIPAVEGIIAMHPGAVAIDDSGLEVITLDQASAFDPIPAIDGARDDLATLIYTSGTTGMPKGVMLTHGNILSNCESNREALELGENDMVLSFLPVAHAFERTAGYYTIMTAGGMIAYAEGLTQLAQNLLEVEPTVVLTVPRLLRGHLQPHHADGRSGIAAAPEALSRSDRDRSPRRRIPPSWTSRTAASRRCDGAVSPPGLRANSIGFRQTLALSDLGRRPSPG